MTRDEILDEFKKLSIERSLIIKKEKQLKALLLPYAKFHRGNKVKLDGNGYVWTVGHVSVSTKRVFTYLLTYHSSLDFEVSNVREERITLI